MPSIFGRPAFTASRQVMAILPQPKAGVTSPPMHKATSPRDDAFSATPRLRLNASLSLSLFRKPNIYAMPMPLTASRDDIFNARSERGSRLFKIGGLRCHIGDKRRHNRHCAAACISQMLHYYEGYFSRRRLRDMSRQEYTCANASLFDMPC